MLQTKKDSNTQKTAQINSDMLDGLDDLEKVSKQWNQSVSNQTQLDDYQGNLEESRSTISKESYSQENRDPNIQQLEQSVVFSKNADFSKQMTTNHDSFNSASQSMNITRGPRNHIPQIIDEDTQHFKIKIEHLMNVFQTQAISEFMGMKKSMLDDQRVQIKCETEKYLNMYQEQQSELNKTQEALTSKISEFETLSQKFDSLSQITGGAQQRVRTLQWLSRYFSAIKIHQKEQQAKKLKQKMAEKFKKTSLARRFMNYWQDTNQEALEQKRNDKIEAERLQEVEEISCKYNQEMELLRERLAETSNLLRESNFQKQTLQDDLQKAFMRGVCALNFEAMSILNTQSSNNAPMTSEEAFMLQQQQQLQQKSQNQLQSQTENISSITNQMQNIINADPQTFNSLMIDPVNYDRQGTVTANHASNEYSDQSHFNKSKAETFDDNIYNQKIGDSPKQQSVVFFQAPKLESKDHKWRDAPVVGVKAQTSETIQRNKSELMNQDQDDPYLSHVQQYPDYAEQNQDQENDDNDDNDKELEDSNDSLSEDQIPEKTIQDSKFKNAPLSNKLPDILNTLNSGDRQNKEAQEGRVVRVNPPSESKEQLTTNLKGKINKSNQENTQKDPINQHQTTNSSSQPNLNNHNQTPLQTQSKK